MVTTADRRDYQFEGRLNKAWRLARWLDRQGFDAEMAARFTPEQWQTAAAAAKVVSPSEACCWTVVGLLTPKPLHESTPPA